MTGTGGGGIVVIGPVPPLKGGVAQHTDRLARELFARHHDVVVESWAAQYPRRLYPGEQLVPDPAAVEDGPYVTRRALRWFSPVSWIRAGWRARSRATVVFTLVVPVQVIPFLVILATASIGRKRPRFVVVAHNVLPHEPRVGDRALVSRLARAADALVVHSDREAEVARQLSPTSVAVEPLPPHPPTAERADRRGDPPTSRLLFFGLVRPYKGIDDLLDALVKTPDVELRVAGEVWGGVEALEAKIGARGLRERVGLLPGYVADADVADVFADCDALVLPYREGTGSQNVLLGHQLGLPVIATEVAGFASQINDGRDGFVCPPRDPDALASAIRRLYEPGVLEDMREEIEAASRTSVSWAEYVTTLLSPSGEGRSDHCGR